MEGTSLCIFIFSTQENASEQFREEDEQRVVVSPVTISNN
jgi:hypothetical protein